MMEEYAQVFYTNRNGSKPHIEVIKEQKLGLIVPLTNDVVGFRTFKRERGSVEMHFISEMTYFGEELSLDAAEKKYPKESKSIVAQAKKLGYEKLVRLHRGVWNLLGEKDVVMSACAN